MRVGFCCNAWTLLYDVIFVPKKENYRLGDGKCFLFLSRADLRNFNGRTSIPPPSPFLYATSRPIFRNLACYPPKPTSLSPKTCLLFLQNLRAFARQAAGLGEKSPELSDNEVRDWGDKVRRLGNEVPRGYKKTVGQCLSVYAKLKLNVRWNNECKYNTFRKECQEVWEFILERNEKNQQGNNGKRAHSNAPSLYFCNQFQPTILFVVSCNIAE